MRGVIGAGSVEKLRVLATPYKIIYANTVESRRYIFSRVDVRVSGFVEKSRK